jgi:sec-independent protein translocase protein TatA
VIEDLLTPQHLIILFALLFFLFGAKRLPGLGKSLGHGIREFRSGISGLSDVAPEELPGEAVPEAGASAGADADDAVYTEVEGEVVTEGEGEGEMASAEPRPAERAAS